MSTRVLSRLKALRLLALATATLLAGCGTKAPKPGQASATTASASAASEENWDVFYLGDARIGYGVTRRGPAADDASLVQTETVIRLTIRRFDQETESQLTYSTVETAAGQLRQARGVAQLGGDPIEFRAQASGAELQTTTTTGGNTVRGMIPWSADCRGFFAIEESLRRSPMQPGEKRTLRMLLPVIHQLASVELRAVAQEATELLDSSQNLLRIESITTLADKQTIADTLWTDPLGQMLKSVNAAMQQVIYRTTKEVAQQDQPAAVLDIGKLTLVKTPQPIGNPHDRQQLRYRVRLAGGDPAKAFASDESQRLTSVDANTADVVVRAIRPDTPRSDVAGKLAPPDADDRQPNSYIQSDDPRIVTMAREAAGDEQDPWRAVVALERYVNQKITKKNFSQTFATAADVAASLEGDCTEHAVLLAALARARGIPSRVALGLVYVPSEQAFGFHMWTEVYVSGRWIGVDGTLGQGGLGAGHLKLTTASLKEGAAMSSFLPVAQVLGRLRIEEIAEE